MTDTERTTHALKDPVVWAGMALSVAFMAIAIFAPEWAAVFIFLLLIIVFILFQATYPYYGGVDNDRK